MCGICGIIKNSDQSVSESTVKKMNSIMHHRGPDDEGYFFSQGIGIGMRRLSIIDLETGRQPVFNENKSIVVIFNGEIYNYIELRKSLIQKGHKFRTQSDTEVIVHLYEERGLDFIHELRGMFAICLWDKNEKRLILVRDRIGIKPLYYACIDGQFLFASEIKSILVSGVISKEINWKAFDAYFTYNYIPAPLTIYKNIFHLLPGHYLAWHKGNFKVERYWNLDFTQSHTLSEEETIYHLEELLHDSVKYRLISDVPLGVFLSGGIDSSTVVAFMREAGATSIKTFSLGFNVKEYNELSYAQIVSETFGTDHTQFRVNPDMLSILPKLIWHLDQPFADDSLLPTYLVSQLAREHVTVALGGDGGDELFGGYEWTRRYQYSGYFQQLPESMKMFLIKWCNDEKTKYYRASGIINALKRFIYDSSLSLQGGFDRRTTNSLFFRRNLYSNEVINELKEYDALRLRDPIFSQKVKDKKERMLLADLHFYLPDDILFKVDRMSMANSLEARVPLLDHKLVEFAAGISFDQKIRGFTTKFLLKKILGRRLSKQILKQRKQGFSLPVGHWFREDTSDLLRQMVNSTKIENFFNRKFISWMSNEHRNKRQDFGPRLFSILTFLLWFEIGFNQNPMTVPDSKIEQYII